MESPKSEPVKHVKSQDELKQELQDQIELLKSSVSSYDKGLTAEAKRMATIMRILFSDSSKANARSKSLLLQLNIKEELRYHSVLHSEEIPDDAINLIPGGLAMQTKLTWRGGSSGLFPILGEAKNKLNFDSWWNQFLYKSAGIGLTRRELILSIADRDGGAHVDAEVSGEYAQLSRITNNNTGITVTDESGPRAFINDIKLERVLMRQIAHEVLSTFDEQLYSLIGSFSAVDPTINFSLKKSLGHVEQYALALNINMFYGEYISARVLFDIGELKEACIFVNSCIVKGIKSILLWWGGSTEINDILYLYKQLNVADPDLCKLINYSYIKSISNIIKYVNLDTDQEINDFGFVINSNKFLAELDYIHFILTNKLSDYIESNIKSDNPDHISEALKKIIDEKKASKEDLYVNSNYIVANALKEDLLKEPDLVLEYRVFQGELMMVNYFITHNPDQKFDHIAFPKVGTVHIDHPEYYAKTYENYIFPEDNPS